jgi:hypothetical protein
MIKDKNAPLMTYIEFAGRVSDERCPSTRIRSESNGLTVHCMNFDQSSYSVEDARTLLFVRTDSTVGFAFEIEVDDGECTCFSGYGGSARTLTAGESDFVNLSSESALLPELLFSGADVFGKAYRLICNAPPCSLSIAPSSGTFTYSYWTGNVESTCDEHIFVAEGQATEPECIELTEEETIFLIYEGDSRDTSLTISLVSGECLCFTGDYEAAETLNEGDSTTVNLSSKSALLPESLFSGVEVLGKAYELICSALPCAVVITASSGDPAYSYWTANKDSACVEYAFVAEGQVTESTTECMELEEEETMFLVYGVTRRLEEGRFLQDTSLTISLVSGECLCYDTSYQQPIPLDEGDSSSLDLLENQAVVPLPESTGTALRWLTYEMACASPPCYAAFETDDCFSFLYDVYEHSSSLPTSCDDYTLVTNNAEEFVCFSSSCLDLSSAYTTVLTRLLFKEANDTSSIWTVSVSSGECPCYFGYDYPIQLGVGDIDSNETDLFLREVNSPVFDLGYSNSNSNFFLSYEVYCESPPCIAQLSTPQDFYEIEYVIFDHSSSLSGCADYSFVGSTRDTFEFCNSYSLCLDLTSVYTTILVRNIPNPEVSFVGSLTVEIYSGFCSPNVVEPIFFP